MASSDEDEDLKRAIELSLQDQMLEPEPEPEPKPKNKNAGYTNYSNTEVIDLDSDEDLSRTCTPQILENNLASMIPSDSSGVCKNSLGLDRKAMEQERLARKRKVSISPPPLRKKIKVPVDESTLDGPPPLKTSDSSKSLDVSRSKVETELIKPVITPTSGSEPTFLDAAVRKTWALGYDRQEDIKFEEVLQRNDLTLAVISSFQWDIDWLFSKLDTKSTQVTLIMQAKEESLKRQYEEETSTMPNLRLCFPPMEGSVQCMHSKLMLLGHPSYLRIVVTTANLVPYDWGETGIMENMVFLIDLPRLPANHAKHPLNQMTSFAKELIYFLEAMGLDGKIVQSIPNFDFSRTKDLAFVHSIGGVHAGKEETWRRTGFCGLGTAIRELGLANGKTLAIDYVTSSMGALNIDFLMILYLAAQGGDGLTEYDWRNAIPKTSQTKGNEEQQTQRKALETMQEETRKNFRVYYPTHETVAASNGGIACGGTISFLAKFFAYPQFPRGVLRDCWSRRVGLLMHNKLILVRSVDDLMDPSPAWAYIGSANCSESAWGKMTKDRVLKTPRLTCRNWECGVVIPVRKDVPSGPEKGNMNVDATEDAHSMKIFNGIFPIPMETPGKKYGARKPWSSRGDFPKDPLHAVLTSNGRERMRSEE